MPKTMPATIIYQTLDELKNNVLQLSVNIPTTMLQAVSSTAHITVVYIKLWWSISAACVTHRKFFPDNNLCCYQVSKAQLFLTHGYYKLFSRLLT
jgi:hypothetical protein